MTNVQSPQTEADVPRVDLTSEESVKYWCDYWSVSPGELATAVEHAGDNAAPAVAFALGREAWQG